MRSVIHRSLVFLVGFALCVGSSLIHGQAYPSKPIRIVVPFAPGGPADVIARTIAQKLGESLEQQVVVDNRAGAGGMIGFDLIAKSAPDGYNIVFGPTTILTYANYLPKVPFDSLKDFEPISLVATVPNILVVHPSVPVRSVKDLIALAKAQPGTLTFASSGPGSSSHRSGLEFNLLANTDLVHVPYKGGAPATVALLSGAASVVFGEPSIVWPQVKAGRLRALAVTSAARSTAMPELPTIAEGGVPGYDIATTYGLFAPVGTSKEIVNRLSTEIVKLLSSPDVRESLLQQGVDPVGGSPEQLATEIRKGAVKYSKIITDDRTEVLPKPIVKPAPKPSPRNVEFGTEAFFSFNKAELLPGSKVVLADLAFKALSINLGAVIATGHAERSETNPSELSVKRAQTIKDFLVGSGIDPKLIFWEGKGAKSPIPDSITSERRAKNRRVQIDVVGTIPFGGESLSKVDSRLIPILFATSRKRSKNYYNPETYFSDEEIDPVQKEQLTLGSAVVRVPPKHKKGEVEEPGWIRLTVEKMTPKQLLEVVGIDPFTAIDPGQHFSFARPIEELNDDDFKNDLERSLIASKSKSALLYVHGYANSFKDGAFRTAQLTYDLVREGYDAVPIMFSWPSDPNGVNYTGAKDRINSSGKQLAMFLDKIFETTGAGVVHIVAHSMGAEVLAKAFNEMSATNLMVTGPDGRTISKFNQIVLAAPDIRAADFNGLILPAVQSGHRVTNYASSNDKALLLSKKANAGPRAGDTGKALVLVKGVETIDATAVNNSRIGHSFFAESPRMILDMKALLQRGAKPAARGLQQIRRKDLIFWYFEK